MNDKKIASVLSFFEHTQKAKQSTSSERNLENERIIHNMKNAQLGMDDTFKFRCKKCGECCQNIEIMLSSFDIFQIAKFLYKSPAEIITSYCRAYNGCDSKYPLYEIKLRGDGTCPFLIRKLCLIDSVKPTACRLFPLGRVFTEDRAIYFEQEVMCRAATDQENIVRDWIKNLPENDEIAQVYSKALQVLIQEYTVPISKQLPKEQYNRLTLLMREFLYHNFKTEQDFLQQFKINFELLLEMLKGLKQLLGIQ